MIHTFDTNGLETECYALNYVQLVIKMNCKVPNYAKQLENCK